MITLTTIGHKQRRNRNYRRVWPVAPTSGIGTTSPQSALDVSGSIVLSDGNAFATNKYYSGGWKYKANGWGGHMQYFNTGGFGLFVNAQNSSGTGVAVADIQALMVNPNGNVGIGTTAPTTALTIAVPTGKTPISTFSGAGGQWQLGQNAGPTSNDDTFGLYSYTKGGGPIWTATTTGNVGIGTASPTQGLLTVNGNVVALGQSPAGAGGSYVALTNTIGNLPGYPSWSYPTIKTDATNLYLSISGNYSGYFAANGAYVSVSDRNRKENFVEVNTQELLEKLDGMPMFEWNFKGEDPGVRHIGPIAQDFHDSFHLNGSDEKKISHIDPSGVAIVGVKGLLTRVKGLESENAALKARADKAETESAQLKAALCSKFPDLPLCKFNASN